jgi:hypothetical protein
MLDNDLSLVDANSADDGVKREEILGGFHPVIDLEGP